MITIDKTTILYNEATNKYPLQSSKDACESETTHNADVQDSRQLKTFQPYYKKKSVFISPLKMLIYC